MPWPKLEIVMNELRRFKPSADFLANSSHIIESAAISRDLYIAKNQKLCQSQNSKWKNFAKAEYWHLF